MKMGHRMRTKIKTLNRFAFAGKGTVSGDMALDLLDARELIKEMRGLIKDVYVSGLSTSRNCAIDKLLERTKEYA